MIFPEIGITKNDVIEYYLNINQHLLKFIKHRPLTLQRFPQGIDKPGFIQKHAKGIPNWVKKIELPAKTGSMEYMLAENKADIAYFSNLNTITFHAALSTIKNVYYPDTLIWDLDPSDDDFEKVIKCAFIVKDLADQLKIACFVKTTGSKGLHILVPLDEKNNFDTVHEFSKNFAHYLAKVHSKEITIALSKSQRQGKVLIDYMRNSYGQTAVTPYSLRPLSEAPIATPIEWDELGKSVLSSRQFNIYNIFEKIEKSKSVWSQWKQSKASLKDLSLNFVADKSSKN